jgi:hypothetical protein
MRKPAASRTFRSRTSEAGSQFTNAGVCQHSAMMVHALLLAAAFAPTNAIWEAGIATSYVRGGSFDGPGFAVHSLWAPSDYFAVGPVIDLAYLSSGLRSDNGFPASYAFTSTLVGGLARLRFPLRSVEPYAGVALGYLAIAQRRSVNTECALQSGPGIVVELGARAAISDRLALGLQGSARPLGSPSCAAVYGPAGFDLSTLYAASSTLDYRW